MKLVALGALYGGDDPEDFREALDSIRAQTLTIDIWLTVDGPLTEKLELLIVENTDLFTRIIRSTANEGLSYALNRALHLMGDAYDYVIRFDADDINLSTRFETTYQQLERTKPDLIGFSMAEFAPGYELKKRMVREGPLVLSDFRFKNPIFHPTVAFKLKTIRELDFYSDVQGFEDWATWLKFIQDDRLVISVNVMLVHFRVSPSMVARRFGWAYFKKEIDFSSYRRNFFPLHVEYLFLGVRLARNLTGFKIFNIFFQARS